MIGKKEFNDASAILATLPLIQYGTTAVLSVAKKSYNSAAVTFPQPFSAAPSIYVCGAASSTDGDCGETTVSVMGVSATGFTARAFNGFTAAKSMAINWIAIGNR